MAKPLRSEDPTPRPVQFSHFGVLNDGTRSKGAALTSIGINVAILLLILVVGAMVKKNPILSKKVDALMLPPQPVEPPKPAPKPPPPPPKPLPKPPVIKEPPPKIIKPPEPVPLPPKPVIVATPKPVVLNNPAPRKVDPPPAPVKVNLATPHAASIANNDAHPSAVRLGNPEIKALNGPSVAQPVNLAGGMHNMPASNTGSGPRASVPNLGSGSPGGTNLNGTSRAATPVKGLATGYGNTPGGSGPYQGPRNVQMGIKPTQVATPPQLASTVSQAKPPVFYVKPKPVYTADAMSAHVEGTIYVRIHVMPDGSVEYLGATNRLGHGLDEAARAVVQGMRAHPALDVGGRPTDWTGSVAILFQMS